MNTILRWYRTLKDYQKVSVITAIAGLVPAMVYQMAIHDWKEALIGLWMIILFCGVAYAVNGWINDV